MHWDKSLYLTLEEPIMQCFIESVDKFNGVMTVVYTDPYNNQDLRVAVPIAENVNTNEDFQNHISKFAPHLHFKMQNEKHEKIKTGIYDNIDPFIGQTVDVNEPLEGDDQVY